MIEFTPEVTMDEYGANCLQSVEPKGDRLCYVFGFTIGGAEVFDAPIVDAGSNPIAVLMSSFDVAKRTFNQYWSARNRIDTAVKASLH